MIFFLLRYDEKEILDPTDTGQLGKQIGKNY